MSDLKSIAEAAENGGDAEVDDLIEKLRDEGGALKRIKASVAYGKLRRLHSISPDEEQPRTWKRWLSAADFAEAMAIDPDKDWEERERNGLPRTQAMNAKHISFVDHRHPDYQKIVSVIHAGKGAFQLSRAAHAEWSRATRLLHVWQEESPEHNDLPEWKETRLEELYSTASVAYSDAVKEQLFSIRFDLAAVIDRDDSGLPDWMDSLLEQFWDEVAP